MNSLNFIKIRSNGQIAENLEKIISGQLSDGESVLWLLSGGSAVGPAVAASKLLAGRDLSRLTISLGDERYGPPGHQDSNWRNIIDQGFEPGNAALYPVLTGIRPDQTAAEFSRFLEKQLANTAYKLALLGIGSDGHTAGILPASPAVGSNDCAVYYKAPDYERITITPKGLALVDEAIVYCRGDEKAEALTNLGRDLSVSDQPAQIIKQIARVSVYNDIKGD